MSFSVANHRRCYNRLRFASTFNPSLPPRPLLCVRAVCTLVCTQAYPLIDACMLNQSTSLNSQGYAPCVCTQSLTTLQKFTPAHGTLGHCWFIVCSASATLDQQWINIGYISLVCLVSIYVNLFYFINTFCIPFRAKWPHFYDVSTYLHFIWPK